MEGMKILITTDWYKPVINGVVTSVVTLKEQLEGLGCRVRVVTLSGNGHAYRDGDVYYLPSVNASRIYPGARAVCPPCRGIGEILAWKPDLIHSQCEFSSFLIASGSESGSGFPSCIPIIRFMRIIPIISVREGRGESRRPHFFPALFWNGRTG